MINPDALTSQFRAWGQAQVNRYAYRKWERSDHVLAKQRELGAVKRSEDHEPIGRDGYERRAYMAKRSGVQGMAVLPMWAVDPIRAANDASPPHDNPEVAVDMGTPDDLLWLDRAVSQLFRVNMVRALCFREEFCSSGTQMAKAKRVAEAYGGQLSVWQYRRELQRARDFIEGKRAA